MPDELSNDMQRQSAAQESGAEASEATTPRTTEEELAAVRAQLEEAERERGQYKGLLQRAQADFINFRRRVDEEREAMVQQATSRFASKLLPVMDEFKLAIEHAQKSGAEVSWLEGVQLIYRKLQDILESEGLKRIEAEGQMFDPWEHEALLHQETPSHEEGRILAVIRDGYKLYGRVLRPAQVVVAKAPQAQTAESPPEGPPRDEGQP